MVMLSSSQPAPEPGDRAVPALSMGGLLLPTTRRVPASPHVPRLATGCRHSRHSLDTRAGQHFPCRARASAARNSVCEAAHPSVRSPRSGGRTRSPAVGAFSICAVSWSCGADPDPCPWVLLQRSSTDICWGLFLLTLVQVERQPQRGFP